VNNFRPLLWFYRKLFDHEKDYLAHCPESNERDYLLSEFHGENGLSGPKLAKELSDIGFLVKQVVYHWEGMGPAANFLKRLGLSKASIKKRASSYNSSDSGKTLMNKFFDNPLRR